jgi:hypothetical protein
VATTETAGETFAASHFQVLPSYPHLCLWPDSALAVFGSADSFPRLAPEWDKRKVPLGTAASAYQAHPLPLAAIYLFSERSADRAPRAEPASKKAALLALVANTYANNLLDASARAEEFSLLNRLVDEIPVRTLTPHLDPIFIPQLCNFICNDFKSLPAHKD